MTRTEAAGSWRGMAIGSGLAAIMAMVLTLMVTEAARAADGQAARLNEPFELTFPGNPGTGYRWQFDEASNRQNIVAVETLGYQPPPATKPLRVGAPAPFIFRVTCIVAGTARLKFDYVGPTGVRAESRKRAIICR